MLVPLCLPFVSPSTYLAPSSCDRNRPPRSQVACKLTPFAPPFTQPTPSLQTPRTPTAQRLTKTTSGIFRLLLSGTCMYPHLVAGQAGVAQGGQVGEPAGLGGFSSLRSAPPSPTTWDKTQQIRGLHSVQNFTNNRSVLKLILFT